MKHAAVLLVGLLLFACQSPTETRSASGPDFTKPGAILRDLSFETPALPASLNLGASVSTARSLVTPDQQDTGSVVGSTYNQVLKNIQVNLPQILIRGLQGSAAVTDPALAVGQVVSVGAITMTMGSLVNHVADAGKLTTELSADGQTLTYYWSLGAPLGGDMKILLSVKKDGSVLVFLSPGDGTYAKSDSSASGVFTYANDSGGIDTYLVVDGSDPKKFKTWVRGVGDQLSLYEVALGNNNFGGVLLFNATSAGTSLSVEHYDASGNLVSLLDGDAGGTVQPLEFHSVSFGTSHQYPLSSLSVAEGYQWARSADGFWYTHAEPSGFWIGSPSEPSSGVFNTDQAYQYWLEDLSQETSRDQVDSGDLSVPLLTTTALKTDPTNHSLTGTIHQRVYDSAGPLPAPLTVKPAVASASAASLEALLAYDAQMSSRTDLDSYLDDAQPTLTAAAAKFPILN